MSKVLKTFTKCFSAATCHTEKPRDLGPTSASWFYVTLLSCFEYTCNLKYIYLGDT